jgi:hypothetical protein
MEQTILVCDVCGAPAATTVTLKVDGKSLQKDLCSDHVGELVHGARPARPGRRRSPGPAPARRRAKSTRAKSTRKSTRAKSTRGGRASKKSTATGTPRRGRPPRVAAEPAPAVVETPSTE